MSASWVVGAPLALATLAKSAVVGNPAVCSIGAPWGAAAPFNQGSPSYVEIDMVVVGVITELSLETMGNTPGHVGANTYGQTTEVTIESSYNKKVWTPLPGGSGLDITKEGFAENNTLAVTRIVNDVSLSGGSARTCATVKVVPASPIAARYIRVTATRSV